MAHLTNLGGNFFIVPCAKPTLYLITWAIVKHFLAYFDSFSKRSSEKSITLAIGIVPLGYNQNYHLAKHSIFSLLTVNTVASFSRIFPH